MLEIVTLNVSLAQQASLDEGHLHLLEYDFSEIWRNGLWLWLRTQLNISRLHCLDKLFLYTEMISDRIADLLYYRTCTQSSHGQVCKDPMELVRSNLHSEKVCSFL